MHIPKDSKNIIQTGVEWDIVHSILKYHFIIPEFVLKGSVTDSLGGVKDVTLTSPKNRALCLM
jgi:hypothetical protein